MYYMYFSVINYVICLGAAKRNPIGQTEKTEPEYINIWKKSVFLNMIIKILNNFIIKFKIKHFRALGANLINFTQYLSILATNDKRQFRNIISSAYASVAY